MFLQYGNFTYQQFITSYVTNRFKHLMLHKKLYGKTFFVHAYGVSGINECVRLQHKRAGFWSV